MSKAELEAVRADELRAGDRAISIIWTAAMTAACNTVIKRQNDLNDDDGPIPILNEQGEIIDALKVLLEPDTGYLEELRDVLGYAGLSYSGMPVRNALLQTAAALQVCCRDERDVVIFKGDLASTFGRRSVRDILDTADAALAQEPRP